MEMLGALGFSLILAILTKIPYTQAQDCKTFQIESITSPSASSLLVKWKRYEGATNYFLDLRVINTTNIAPVVVTLSASSTEKRVQGLRPATAYTVTVKVFRFYRVMCQKTKNATTVPDTPQITYAKAISSTAIRVKWSAVEGSERYVLVVQSDVTREKRTLRFVDLTTDVHNLHPWTAYNFTVYSSNLAGLGAASKVITMVTLIQPPPGLTATQTGKKTARISWEEVEKVLLYEVIVTDLTDPGSSPLVKNVSTLYLDIIIQPCASYRISAASLNNFLEPGDFDNITYTTNTLGPVTSISVDYHCSHGTVMVSWGAVFGADSYRAAAIDRSGTVLSCTSETEECQIAGVRCGERYLVHVAAISNSCESTANATTHFETMPCPPTGLDLYRECSSNLIIFSWAPTNNTSHYIARAVDNHEVQTDCITSETACFFTDTFCGRLYKFTVYSVSGECSSGVSESVEVRTAPCAPDSLRTTTECKSDVLHSTWDMAAGAISYSVQAWGNTEPHNRYNCSSNTNSCAMPGVHCGESLTMWIISSDNECSSERALGEVAETVPCVPQNVSAVLDCTSNSVRLRWQYSHGAAWYIGSVVHSDGSVTTCSTMDTHCEIMNLHCGQIYSAFVIAANLKCNSSESEHVSVATGPCPPDHVEAFLDCTANNALVTWESHLSGASYIATMEDQQGGLLSCMTMGNRCRIPDLKCGQDYAVRVTSHNGMCLSVPSNTIQLDSVPCGPENVWTNVDCGTGVLNVGWNLSAEAEGYTTIVSSGNGEQVYCNSTEPHCSFDTLECGQSYTVTVMSVIGSCLSMPSKEAVIQEAPCLPTNVMVHSTCGESSVEVTWEASQGANYYIAVATGDDGHTHECSSNSTTCSFLDLHCSEVYSIGVMAVDDNCTSLHSQTVTLRTVPCSPSHVDGSIDCMSNTASISWDISPNAVLYTGVAVGTDGHSVSCESSSPRCQISGLQCGQEYTFTVSATDGSCQSSKSMEFTLESAPCAPQNVGTHVYCDSNVLTVIWDSDAPGLNYSATVWTASGTVHSCTSLQSSCDIRSLSCGQQYSVTVMASNSNCRGPASAAHNIQTAPCIPQDVTGQVECGSNILTTSWSSSPGASTYIGTVSGPDGFSESCSTSDLTCSFRSLRCAQLYTFSVMARDLQCNGTASTIIPIATGPCDPENVDTIVHCQSNMVMVSWDSSAGARRYTVLAQDKDGDDLSSCSTMDTSCQLSQLECSETFRITVLADDGTCNSSVQSRAVIETAPCPPVLAYTLDCATDIASVSWGSDEYAVGFVINATSNLGLKSSCSTTNTTCELSDLQCGQTYTMHGVALGQECNSEPSAGVNIVTAPCTPASVTYNYDCVTNIALVTWDDSLGRDSFYTTLEGDGHMVSCHTSETTCYFTSLECGQTYNVNVKAMASHCNSSQAATTKIKTAPCAPQNVSASLMCAKNTAIVSWAATEGAVAYNVTALGRDGDLKTCRSTNTSCSLPMMHCGQIYGITVTPYSETCTGFHSAAISYTAGPCPPNNVAVALECEGNVGVVSWESVIGADHYTAMARADDGHEHNCTSSSATCRLTDLHCGEIYSVTVVTFMRGCYSDPSPGVNIKTAICPPMNLEGHTSCETSIMTIMWDASPVLGVTYFLVSQKEGGASTTYSTADTSYFITGSQCGERYSFRAITQDSICNSSLSLPLVQDTAPCRPTNLEVEVDCGTSSGTISWAPSLGAETYVVEAVGTHGHRASCSTNSTTCSVRVDCGRRYTATVISSNAICNSTRDAIIQFDSAPCLPENVVAELDCSSNEFAVRWQGNAELDSYTALAISTNGHRATCDTSTTACTIQNLQCGQIYSIAVTSPAIDCGIIQGSNYMVQSAPCEPLNPVVNLNCSSNMANVSWDYRMAQQIYNVTMVDQQGHSAPCSTTNNNCIFDQLSCGESYSFSVMGLTDQCRTAASPTVNFLTAPCVPTHVVASLDCSSGIATIMWDTVRGAVRYTVQAEGSRGHTTSCQNTDTHCAISDMKCGQDYTIIVFAHNQDCDSLPSNPTTVTTGPCPHSNLQASLDCSSNSAVISWTPGNGTLMYNASAESFAIGHYLSCSTEGSTCNITSMHCGQRYTVSVVGMGHSCPSITGSWIIVNTAPCPPTHVNVQHSCGSNMASVSWTMAEGAVTYMATAEDGYGNVLTCNTSNTVCDIMGLSCGQAYNMSVTALDENCVGGKSEIHMLKTAPCVPMAVETNLVCQTGLLTVSWQHSDGAEHYWAMVHSSGGRINMCRSENSTCVFPELPCGDTYNVTVFASDKTCNSSHSPAKYIAAAPCPPGVITASVDCATNIITILWDTSAHDVLYTVRAIDASGHSSTCNTSDSNCALTTLECGTEYNVTVSGSVDSCVGALTSEHTIRTAPCVPILTEVEMDCLSDSAWVVWEESVGAEIYMASAMDSLGRVFQCTTLDSTCAVPDLHCGQHYSFSVTASDQQCTSAPSNMIMSESAPCPPQNIQANVSCEIGTASISWAESYLALTYTATLEHPDGQTFCCTSAGTNCDITDLPCGQMYVLIVVAEGHTCNSTQSMGTIIRTVPCTPQNLAASVNCNTNVATATWSSSKGGQMYLVEARNSDGHSTSCFSHLNTCDLENLQCGQQYTVTVVAQDSSCTSAVGQSTEIKTVPCIPQNVTIDVDCELNGMSISWEESDGADSYTATVEDSDGRSTNCVTLGNKSCSVSGLNCGKIYHVTVTASDGYCTSADSSTANAHSVPCAASRIQAFLDCQTQTAITSWYLSRGALSYTATLETDSGHVITCNTNTTNCEMSGLACGEQYSLSVLAQGDTCSRSAQMTEQLQTEPCVPLNLDAQYSLSIGQLLWDQSKGAAFYSAEAITSQGLIVTCNTTDTSCALYDMECGQVYNITVTANNQACSHNAISDPISLTTEPCPPRNVEAHMNCQTGRTSVSWEQSDIAVGYMVFLDGRNGHSTSCYSTDTSCSVDGLHCGTVYYIYVKAIGPVVNSTDSATILLTTAPCRAGDVEVRVDCENDTALMSWSWIDGAESYTVTAMGASSHMVSCSTEENSCRVTDLICGENYTISLTSINEQCDILSPTGVTFQTRPCAPLRLTVDLQCGTHTAALSWAERDGVEFYIANALTSTGEDGGSCNTSSSMCLFPNLNCGETYSFTVTAHSNQCHSDLSDTAEITTEPCQPEGVFTLGSCFNDTVHLCWNEAQGVDVYIVTATGNLGYITAFNTTGTRLPMWLPCGQTYTFTVLGQDERCDSISSIPVQFRTAPCIPQHVRAYAYCEDSVGSVSWAESDGAESYTAVAVGQDGHTHMCTTNSTTCTWTDLHCGEVYTVHIIADDILCSSSPSNSTTIYMASCVPQNLVSSMNCERQMGILSWDASETAELYIVSAENSNGHRLEFTTNATSTFITALACGEVYFLTVRAVNALCISTASPAISQQTEPCAPTNVTTQLECFTNIVEVSWTTSKGAEYYTAMVQAADGQSAICMSSGSQCGIANLLCGQNYTVSVTASNTQCNSTPSESTRLCSAPCVPQDVTVVVDCLDNTALVSWNRSQGALSYTAIADGAGGVHSTCGGSETHCILTDLSCGTPYTVWVSASDDNCSTLMSEPAQFLSVPCRPEIDTIHLDCYFNSLLIEWNYVKGASFYTAVAETSGGDIAVCSTNYTNCEIMDLECSQVYAVRIVASNGYCNSSLSPSWEVASVPCPPQRVMHHLDCDTNSAHVTWEESSGAEHYEVHAIGIEGHITGCNTTDLECVVPDLMCGCTYNISVVALYQQCNTSESSVLQMQSVPCVPQHVEASLDCETGVVSSSWELSNGAILYTSVAQGIGGFAYTCQTNGSVCQYPNLLCGMTYVITVIAADDVCSSTQSTAVLLNTVPCEPHNISTQLECDSNIGLVMWEHSEGAASYHVQAVGPDGHRTQCSSSSTSCQLADLHCGQTYNLTVTSQDSVCDTSKAYLSLQSAPCGPRQVMTSLQCVSNSATVSWERGSGALSYQAVGRSTDGHTVSCNSSIPHCDLEALQCGKTYDVNVYSGDESCLRVGNMSSQIRTAPCPPMNMEAKIDCNSGIMMVMWDPNIDAESFHVVATDNDGTPHHCDTNDTFCSITSLPCGHSYTVYVVSIQGGCESAPSRAVNLTTAPCVPQEASGNLDCVTNAAWVTWEHALGAHTYTVIAEAVGGYNSSCSSTDTTCNVPDLRCGVLYTFHVIAYNGHCQSPPSNIFDIETAPCALTTITAVTRCQSDTIQVRWELTEGSPLYIATAEGTDRSVLSCNSTSTSCDLEDAKCDVEYTIIMAASSDKCSSLRSPPFKIKTAPCAPQDVSFQIDCADRGVFVSWAPSFVAQSYLVKAEGRNGDVHTCNTMETNCTLAGLQCGQPYALTVTAKYLNCTSPPSSELRFNTVPCDPSNLNIQLQCASNSAVVSWDRDEGSVEYVACAQDSTGDMLYCDSASTSCTIQGLECGSMYNFSVQASDGICNSSFSEPLLQGAVPCPPDVVASRLLPMSDGDQVVRVSWNIVICPGVEYLVEMTGSIMTDRQQLFDVASYWTDFTFFEFPLPCSSMFRVTVRSGNAAGMSEPSREHSGTTGPCPPVGFTYTGNSTHATLSWDASLLATSYTVYELTSVGRNEVCNTARLSCMVMNVNLSAIILVAKNFEGESNPVPLPHHSPVNREKRSVTQERDSEELSSPEVSVSKVTSESLQVEWREVRGATHYSLVISDPAGYQTHHNHTSVEQSVHSETYTVTNLQPATTYCVSVSAKNCCASSSFSQPICVDTEA